MNSANSEPSHETTAPEDHDQRRSAELAERLATLQRRVKAAASSAGRVELPTVVAVTKYFPVADIVRLYHLGVRDFGENKAQDLADKAQACADLPGVRWHFIGQIQSNKTSVIARHAHVVHSVDRRKLVARLADGATSPLTCLVQVNLDASDQPGARGGASPHELADLAEAIAATEGLRLGGVMAVAPRETEPSDAFSRLEKLAAETRTRYPEATAISAGMSLDLETAVRHGATHLRIGSDILGPRDTSR